MMVVARLLLLLSLGIGMVWFAAWVTGPSISSGTVWFIALLWSMIDVSLVNIMTAILELQNKKVDRDDLVKDFQDIADEQARRRMS